MPGIAQPMFTVLFNQQRRSAGPPISYFAPYPAQAGQTVYITGTGFLGATAVKFNGIAASSFTIISDTLIAAVVPIFPGQPLLDSGVVSAWKLGEATGLPRLDSVGTNDLANTNAASQIVPGKIGNATGLVSASAQTLSITDNAALSTGDIDFSIDGWFWLTTIIDDMAIAAKGDTGANTREWLLTYGNGTSNGPTFWISANGSTRPLKVEWGAQLSTGAWHHVYAWHDSINNIIGIRIDHGTAVTQATAGVAPADRAGNFWLGASPGSGGNFNGQLDAFVFRKALLSAAGQDATWNSGAGLEPTGGLVSPYVPASFATAPSLNASLVNAWNLGEATGLPRVDNVGLVTLANVNGCSQVSNGVGGNATGFLAASGQFLQASNYSSLNSLTKFSISTWMKRTGASDSGGLVYAGVLVPDGNNRINLNLNTDGNLYFGVCNAGNISQGFVALSGTTLHHIAATFDGSVGTGTNFIDRLKVYVDGVLQTLTPLGGNIPATTPATLSILQLGKESVGNTLVNGLMDATAIYPNRVLSQADVTALRNGGVPLEPTGSIYGGLASVSVTKGGTRTVDNSADIMLDANGQPLLDANGGFVYASRFYP